MMRNRCLNVVAVILGLAMVTTAFDCQANSAIAYQEGQSVTLVLPATSFEKVEKRKKNQVGETFEVKVSIHDDGSLLFGDDPMWRSKSLPLIVAGQVTSIKTSERAKETTLSFFGGGRSFVFRVPTDSPWQQPMAEVLVEGHSSVMEPSPGLTESLSGMLDAYCSHAFDAPLDALDARARRRVAELMLAGESLDPPSTSPLDGKLYLDAGLGAGPGFFNTLTTSESQRIVGTLADRVLPAAKTWADVFYGDVPFHGIKFKAIITQKDFVEYPPRATYENLEFFVALTDAQAYADDDLTARELIDKATVFVDGVREEVMIQ